MKALARRFRSARAWLALLVPFGLLSRHKPRHYREMLKVLWENRGRWLYSLRILFHGVCDGCSLGPRGIRDDVPERLVRPTKYLWIEHAERNAICNAARAGTATEGCTIYVEIMPCMDCARAVVQAGIIQVVVSRERMAEYSSQYYDEHFGMVEVLFKEAAVKVRQV